MNKKQHITKAEWPIMQVLWQQEHATAAVIVQKVTAQKDVSMRTVKTLLRRLVAKGAVTYEVDARSSRIYHYRAAVTEQSCSKEKSDTLLHMVFQNDVGALLTSFLREAKLNEHEIEKLEALLQEKKKELGE